MSTMKFLININGTPKIDHFFGDSITLGVGSGILGRWSMIYCKNKKTTENNHGLSGAPLQNSSPSNPTGAQNFRNSADEDIPLFKPTLGRLFISFGINDVGLNLPNFTATNYKVQLKEVINIAIAKGWPRRSIIVEGPSYCNQAGRDSYVGNYGVTIAADVTRHEIFNTAADQACAEVGVIFDDSYTYMKNNGGDALLTDDNLHPNNAGHLAKATHKLTL